MFGPLVIRYPWTTCLVGTVAVLCTVSAPAVERIASSIPDPPPRFFYNDDGGRVMYLLKGPFHPRQLHYPVDTLVGTGVTTLVFCACWGSDTAYYPSKVASALGWRMTKYQRPDWHLPQYPHQYRMAVAFRARNVDVLGTVMRRAEEQGLEFVPSLRMNDGHFAQKVPPTEHPLTGEFWMKHQDLTIGTADPSVHGYYRHLFDFTHQEVRDYRMAQIDELIEGYAADGLEMDFTRHRMFFPPGRQKPDLITDMVRQTRRRLDVKGGKAGRHLILIVRVVETLDRCRELGFDVPTWIQERLVDYVVPASPNRWFTFDLPLGEFLDVAKGTKVRIVASPDSAGATPDMYRAGMANYYTMGQEDTYLFNFFTVRADRKRIYHWPYLDDDYALLRDLKNPVTLWGRPKRFFAHYPLRTVPLAEPGKRYDIRMYVGDDLALARQENILKQARLHLGISNWEAAEDMKIALNGQRLPLSKAKIDGSSITLDLTDPLTTIGWNTISVTVHKLSNPDSEIRPAVTTIELQVDYDISGVHWEWEMR